MIERTIKLNIDIAPEELAFCFCNMSSEGQARFFNEIAVCVAKWDKPFCFQLSALTSEAILTLDGRRVMEQIGEYAKEE